MPETESSLFGVRLVSSDLVSASEHAIALATSGGNGYICVANVDMVTRAKRDPKLLGILRCARSVVTDGLPLVWALRWKGMLHAQRVYGPRLMLALCGVAAHRGLPVFLFGGTPREIELLHASLMRMFPALKIAGAVSPPMLPVDPPFDAAIAETIRCSGARLLFVGLGCPKQEYWMSTHTEACGAIAIGVGLAFAQIAGTKAAAPMWMQRNGLEWLFRLVQEPRRLWARYLVGNSLFIWYCLRAGAARLSRRSLTQPDSGK